MAFVVKKGGDFVPAPEGVHNAVCVDLIDLGMVPGQYGIKHKMRIVWEIEEKNPQGEPFTVRQQYGVSLHEKATLRKDLKSWRGRDFTAEELEGFDLENILHKPCQVIVEHSEREGNVYANVTKVLKAAKKIDPSGKYVRVKDRPADQQNGKPGQAGTPGDAAETEEIPF
jgi:hypothetical protein